ncbi:MAG TPA: AraC family transcriptional regulator [Chitinophagaceae bacterium]|nr:AraC family transcriptional regulator [Chitinophagaceae bacterium]
MPAQLNIFLLLFGGLQGLLLLLFLVKKKLYSGGYTYLLLYFAVMLLQITLKVMSKLWLMQNWGLVYEVTHFLPLLYGPLIFLFARQLLLSEKFRLTHHLHFLPFAFMFFYLLLSKTFSFSIPAINFFYRSDTGMVLQLLSLSVYHGLALHIWLRYGKALKKFFSETQRLQMGWIRQFIIGSFLVCAVIAVALHLLYITHPAGLPYRYWFAVLTVFIYWVSYTALTQPSVFSVIKGYGREENSAATVMPKLVVHRPSVKYSNSGLSKEAIANIQLTLKNVTEEQKPYLNPDLTINDLAALTKCNRHHLSQVLNESLKSSFYDYINFYRVEEAKQLLLDTGKENHKIASIAYDAGFNSLSTFNDIFRKYTGNTPSQFRKDLQQVSKQRG